MSETKGTRLSSPEHGETDGGIRRAPRPRGNYTTLRNDVLRDQRLSFRALGVLVEILSRPDNWHSRSETLAAGRREGRDAVRTALSELKAAGYLVQHKVRGERGRIRTVSIVYDEPRDSTNAQVAPETDQPAPDNPTPGFPEVGQPGVGLPGPLRKTDTNSLEEASEETRSLRSLASSSSMRVAPRQRDDEDEEARDKPKREPKPKKTDAQREAEAAARKRRERAKAIAEISRRIDVTEDDAALLCDHLTAEHGAKVLDRYVDTISDSDLFDRLDEARDAQADAEWDAQQAAERRQETAAENRRVADDLANQLNRYHHHASSDQFTAVADALFDAMQAGMTGEQASAHLNRVALPATARKVADHYIRALDPWGAVAA